MKKTNPDCNRILSALLIAPALMFFTACEKTGESKAEDAMEEVGDAAEDAAEAAGDAMEDAGDKAKDATKKSDGM